MSHYNDKGLQEYIRKGRGPADIKAGDRISKIDNIYYRNSYYSGVVRALEGAPGKGTITYISGRVVKWEDDYVVFKTPAERKKDAQEVKKRRKNKVFQKEQITKRFKDLADDLFYKKRRIEDFLDQIPLDQRLQFLRDLSERDKKIYEFFHELKEN